MKTRSAYLFLLSILSFFFTQTLPAQTRNTVWLDGTGANSEGWDGTITDMKVLGYDFVNLVTIGNGGNYQPGEGIAQAADILAADLDEENILGIAHDIGGIILRLAQLQNPNISAMILDGVPNQGSLAIDFMVNTPAPGERTEAQRVIDGIQAIKAGQNCDDCQFVEQFELWVNDNFAAREILIDLSPNSQLIQELRSPQNQPTVPFVVLWGSASDPLTKFISNIVFPFSNSDPFTKCYTDFLRNARKKAKEQFYLSTIRNTEGFFKKVVNFLKDLIEDTPNILDAAQDVIEFVKGFIDNHRNQILAEIQAIRDREEELARVLQCELANQSLSVEWLLALNQNTTPEQTTVEIPILEEYDACLTECGVDMAYGDWDLPYTCEEWCAPILDQPTTTTVVSLYQPNDLLLTEFEQKLEGAAKVYHLVNTNHVQETDSKVGVLADHLQDIFDGGAGAAFVIPK